jgi:hypothetical protein
MALKDLARPFADWIALQPSAERACWRAVAGVLDSMYRDYHDCKGHPSMDLDAHLDDLKLRGTAEAAFVHRVLKSGSLRQADLAESGYPVELQAELGALRADGTPNTKFFAWDVQHVDASLQRLHAYISLGLLVELGATVRAWKL